MSNSLNILEKRKVDLHDDVKPILNTPPARNTLLHNSAIAKTLIDSLEKKWTEFEAAEGELINGK